MIGYFNQKNPSKETFLSEEWPPFMLHLVDYYFYYFTMSETNLAYYYGLSEWQGLKPAMEFLEKKLRQLNISFNELANVFGQRVAEVLSLSISHSWRADDGTLQQKNISSRLVNKEIYCS